MRLPLEIADISEKDSKHGLIDSDFKGLDVSMYGGE